MEAFVGYQMEFDWSVVGLERQEITLLTEDNANREIQIVRSRWVRLGNLHARRFEVQFLRNNSPAIIDHVIALHNGVEYELVFWDEVHQLAGNLAKSASGVEYPR